MWQSVGQLECVARGESVAHRVGDVVCGSRLVVWVGGCQDVAEVRCAHSAGVCGCKKMCGARLWVWAARSGGEIL